MGPSGPCRGRGMPLSLEGPRGVAVPWSEGSLWRVGPDTYVI